MKRIACLSLTLIILLMLTTFPAHSVEYGWTISSSPTDPLANTADFVSGPDVLYLWLFCGDPMSRAYFTVTSSDPLNAVTSVTFLNGFTCIVPACSNPLVFDAPGGCVSGTILVAEISILNNGGPSEFCLEQTQWGFGTIRCDGPGLWASPQIGFTHTGVTPTCINQLCSTPTTVPRPAVEIGSWGGVKTLFR